MSSDRSCPDATTKSLKRLAALLAAGRMDRRAFLTRTAQLGVSGAAALAVAGLDPRRGFARSTREIDALALAYDAIVIGAGSSGAALAGRLSEDPEIGVLLLEAGRAPDLAEIRIPQAWPTIPEHEAYVWSYETAPQPALGGARRPMPRGKTLGGTSAINGMLFVRGHPADFDAWAEAAGDEAWSFQALLPRWRALEDWSGGPTPLRGAGGPVSVARPGAGDRHPAAADFVAAMAAAGHRRKAQINDTDTAGVAWSDLTIAPTGGPNPDLPGGGPRRCSSAVAYLEPAMDRPNLTVVTEAPVERLLFDGRRCVGVAYRHGGRTATVRARREVVLSAGAIDSPRLLMLSGVGPAAELRRHGIAVVADLPGVGREMQEHLMLESLVYAAKRPVPVSAWNHAEAQVFWRSGLDAAPQPDLWAALLSASYAAPYALQAGRALPENGVSVATGVMRCRSRGRLTLASADPRVPARIDPAYMSDPHDLRLLLTATEHARAVMARPEWAEWGLSEVLPGPQVRTAAEMEAFVRAAAGPFCHPAGTCRMGRDPEAGDVVDADLRVFGIEGLRVADAAIVPVLPSTPPNAACLLIGEMAAALVRRSAA